MNDKNWDGGVRDRLADWADRDPVERLGTHDELTGLLNDRGLSSALDPECGRSDRREQSPH
jgi:GGDEF domain-containing protein